LFTLAAQQTIRSKLGEVVSFHERTHSIGGRIDQLPEEQLKIVKEQQRTNDLFVDGFVQMLNDDFDEREVSVSMPKRLKYAYVK